MKSVRLVSWLTAAMLLSVPGFSQTEETNLTRDSLGPSDRAAVKVTSGSSCGSGSVVGENLVLTNAHVAGTSVGKVCKVKAVIDGRDIDTTGRIIMAAYSDKTQTDWAILKTEGLQSIRPVKLSKQPPSGNRYYSKGSPRCVWPQVSVDITTVDDRQGVPLIRWQPATIGGQSGSGVWAYGNNLCEILLTWKWGGLGAGQKTSEIYRQAMEHTVAGEPRPVGLENVNIDTGDDSPFLENGFFAQTGIVDLDIWSDGEIDPGKPPFDDPGTPVSNEQILAGVKHNNSTTKGFGFTLVGALVLLTTIMIARKQACKFILLFMVSSAVFFAGENKIFAMSDGFGVPVSVCNQSEVDQAAFDGRVMKKIAERFDRLTTRVDIVQREFKPLRRFASGLFFVCLALSAGLLILFGVLFFIYSKIQGEFGSVTGVLDEILDKIKDIAYLK